MAIPDPRDGPPDRAAVAFHPPVLLALAIAAGFALRWMIPLSFVSAAAATLCGPLVTALALGLFGWAVLTMLSSKASLPTHTPTSTIVTTGPYARSRNPIYLSILILQVGIGLWANSLWFVVLAGLSAVLLVRGVIVREERYLQRKFADEYESYRGRVRRWL